MNDERSHSNQSSAPKEKQKIQKKERSKLNFKGVDGKQKTSNYPLFNKADCEKVIYNENSYIVLGKDRNASLRSGKSGMGADNCYAIDLVVGRSSSAIKNKSQNSETMVDTNFYTDAARVYISQKSNIDNYLGLCKGSETGEGDSNNRSTVAMKADHVRIVGRNHIKIVTGKGKTNGVGISGEKNSQGGDIEVVGKIDFIAGNNTDAISNLSLLSNGFGSPVNKLQPLVKGENMLELMNDVVQHLENCYDFIYKNSRDLVMLHRLLSAYFIPLPPLSPLGAALQINPTFIEIRKKDIDFQKNNLTIGTVTDFLNEKGERFINSAYVNTT